MIQLHARYIFGFVGGSGFVRGEMVEKAKLERLTQAQYGHRSFWLLLCYHLLISCTCTLVGVLPHKGSIYCEGDIIIIIDYQSP